MWCEDAMSRCEDVKMRRCQNVRMWRWEDVKMWGCEDKKMWRWENVLVLRLDVRKKACCADTPKLTSQHHPCILDQTSKYVECGISREVLSRLSDGEVRALQFQFEHQRLETQNHSNRTSFSPRALTPMLCCIDQWWLSVMWTIVAAFHARAWSDTVRCLEMLRVETWNHLPGLQNGNDANPGRRHESATCLWCAESTRFQDLGQSHVTWSPVLDTLRLSFHQEIHLVKSTYKVLENLQGHKQIKSRTKS
jgi:hypothetical protein